MILYVVHKKTQKVVKDLNIAIIGGGASGLACAITIMQMAENSRLPVKVTVFECKNRIGKKILATGNGRCNMLNTDSEPFYFSHNNFHSFAIKKYDYKSHTEFFENIGLYTRTDNEGRVYPLSNQASTVLDCLKNECDRLGVDFVTETHVKKIAKSKNGFTINGDRCFDNVVLACGGMSAVRDFNGYKLLESLGHKVTNIHPSLSKLNTKNTSDVKYLQGIRQKVKLSLYCNNRFVAEEKGEILFASYGLSGIAIMQLSAYVTRNQKEKWCISADFVSDMSATELKNAVDKIIRHNPYAPCGNLLSGFMPKRVGEIVMKSLGIDWRREVGTLKVNDIDEIVKKAKKYRFDIDSVRPFEDSQVTAGGADTDFFNPKTMESTVVKGFYAVGEVLDVDGLCGGYNLMWAWSSGRLCGESIVRNISGR